MRAKIIIGTLLVGAAAIAACSSDTGGANTTASSEATTGAGGSSSTSPATSTTSTQAGSPTTSTTGTQTTTTTTTTTTTGAGGSGGDGAGGHVPTTNGCTMGGAEDHTADQNVTVHFGPSLMYTPKCILIAAGSSVTWQADQTTPATTFFNHPLEPGELQGTTVIPEPNNPIVATASMTDSVTFTFPDPGTFGYFCGVHGMEFGMEGAVFVQ